MVKKIEDLTRAELVALTQEDYLNVVDWECALRGIKLLPEAPIAPELNIDAPNRTVYRIGDIRLTSANEAQSLMDCLMKMTTLVKLETKDYTNYYSESIKPNDYYFPKIDTQMVFDRDTYFKLNDKMAQYNDAVNKYKDAQKEYNSILDSRNEVISELDEAIGKAIDYEGKVSTYTSLFNRYLTLSNNDVTIAKNFLINAYPDAVDFEEVTQLWGGAN